MLSILRHDSDFLTLDNDDDDDHDDDQLSVHGVLSSPQGLILNKNKLEGLNC